MRARELYRRSDMVGWVLSEWRTRAVLPHVSGHLMDLACGDNRIVNALGSGVGVDIVNYQNVDVVCRDFARLPFRDAEFDTVTILAALNYFDDPVSVLREVRRLLKRDGTVLITFLNKRVSRLWHRFRERRITPRPSLDAAELAACLDAANLRVVGTRSFMFGLNIIYFVKR